MKKVLGISLACVVALTAASYGKPADNSSKLDKPQFVEIGAKDAATIGSALSSTGTYTFVDTATYGETVIDGAADPIPATLGGTGTRAFKAVRGVGALGRDWNFNSGIGSNFTEATQTPKPVGYHHRMEGWKGIDNTYNPLPYYRRSGLCVINGNFSYYAGISLAESLPLCYAGGAGYGDNWNLTIGKTFNYPGSGSVTLAYQYATDAEPAFDYLNVNIDTTGTGAADDINITTYTGFNPAGPASHTLVPGLTMRSSAGPVTIKFNATSDGAYSDEDGGYTTTCGHSSVDDITLSGAIADAADFEAGDNGWLPIIPVSGVGGEWSDIRALSSLPPPLSFCPCAISDSVMVFIDNTGGHQTDVDNLAVSPWADLQAGGDVGRPGRIILFHGYFELPLTNYIFVQTLASWHPAICPQNGQIYVKPLTSDGFVRYFGGVPNCSAPGAPTAIEFSAIVPPDAQQVRIALGVLSYCSMYINCTGVTNTTPWLDHIALGIYGTAGAPIVNLRTIDVFQDNFAADGTLNPSSAGRIDCNNIKGFANPQPGSAQGDTLVVNGDGGNTEVKVVFHVRPGPFTNGAALSAWAAAKWTSEPGIGPGWYSARCDSGEQGGTKVAAKWMATLHESDPKFGGGTDTDRGGEGDLNQLSHDIFPDKILTPGSRIDYFVKARYLPPDPRNPGGTSVFITPDTTGRNYLEVEVLPSSMAADTSWNCTLYVDHHADRDALGQLLEENGLKAVLGSGGANQEGTKYDRYDVQAPSSQQGSFGRPLNTQYGASIIQTFAYKAISWHASNLASFNLVDEDANNLAAWLTINEVGNNRFWASGDGMARSISSESEPTTISFLNNICGVRFNCDTIRLASCPTGSVLDSTFCLPLTNVAGSYFTTALPANGRGNGCPNIRSFDLLNLNTSIPTAKGQLSYVKLDGTRNFSSIANYNTIDVDYKTIIDGVAVGFLRDPNGNTHNAAKCDIQTPATARSTDVINWFQAPTTFNLCKIPAAIVDADPIGTIRPPAFRSSLGNAYPNPMNPTTRIKFTNGRDGGKVNLSIFDVTGRLVKTLMDGNMTAGVHEVTWDGSDNNNGHVSSGMYFIKMSTKDTVQSKKLVVSK